MRALLWEEWHESRVRLLIGLALLVVVAVSVTYAYTSFSEGKIPGLASAAPDVVAALRRLMPDFRNIDAYLLSQWFCKNLAQVGGLLTVILSAGVGAREQSAHTATFLFSRPVSRREILTAKLLVLMGGIGGVTILSTGAAAITAWIIGRPPDTAFLLVALLHALVAFFLMASLSVLVSMLLREWAKGALVAGAVLIGCSFAGQARFFRWLDPFALFGTQDLATHPTLQPTSLAVGIGLAALLLLASYRILERQDL